MKAPLAVLVLSAGSALCASVVSPSLGAPRPDSDELRELFVNPPPGSGTTTLWWLNGKLTKEKIREQLRSLRDRDGFGGVAPLTLFRMKPATEPAYLTDEYFEMYGCILDTAKELGMKVVFYDDCDFPSGTAGNQMAQRYPDDLMKYLARATATVQGPGEAVLHAPSGRLMSVVASNFHQSMPNDSNMLYRAGMEVYARGINYLLPHGTWWDPAKMRIVPEISWRNPEIGPELPRYNRWAARCETLLRAGRHTADIAVLHPIDDLAARYRVGLLPSTHGKEPIPGTDYYEISRLLTGEVRRDFTFLHPEVVDARCRVEGRKFVLDNPNNWERYRVLILPACRTIRVGNLEKARDFLAAGGHVIATTCLPEHSAEFGRDEDVRKMAHEMFGPGGKGIFLPEPNETTLEQTLDELDFAWDVRVTNATDIPRRYRKTRSYAGKVSNDPDAYEGGNRALAYIHRTVPDAEVYFFTNASDLDVTADVQLRGKLHLENWDPHTGKTRPLDATSADQHGEPVTAFKLALPPIRSLFVIGRKRL